MPRLARQKDEHSIYHVVLRGNEQKNIFSSDEDRHRFIDIVLRAKQKYNFLLIAYCLMDNHVHLLIDSNGADISQIMHSINTSYVLYFNRKYERKGHLLQDRFHSEIIEDDRYLLAASRYIHNNPVRAGIVSNAARYMWSSFNIYSGERADLDGLIDISRILECYSMKPDKAVKEYVAFVLADKKEEIDVFMDIEENVDSRVELAKKDLDEILCVENLNFTDLRKKKNLRNSLIISLRQQYSLSLRELGEIFYGLSKSSISKIIKAQCKG